MKLSKRQGRKEDHTACTTLEKWYTYFLIHSMFRELALVRISDKENQINLLGI